MRTEAFLETLIRTCKFASIVAISAIYLIASLRIPAYQQYIYIYTYELNHRGDNLDLMLNLWLLNIWAITLASV